MKRLSEHLGPRDLAALIDISAVQAAQNLADIGRLADIAVFRGFIAAHALPHFVPHLRSLIPAGGPTFVGGPVGFPSGGHITKVKVAEARALVGAGADEMDMMMNIGRLKSGDYAYVLDEIRAVVDAIAPVPLKVIVEMAILSDDELRRASDLVARSGAAFVKTGTGWVAGGSVPARIAIIAETIKGAVEIKASGGIRDFDTIAHLLRLGVTRFGINTDVAVRLVDACAALPGGSLSWRQATAP